MCFCQFISTNYKVFVTGSMIFVFPLTRVLYDFVALGNGNPRIAILLVLVICIYRVNACGQVLLQCAKFPRYRLGRC